MLRPLVYLVLLFTITSCHSPNIVMNTETKIKVAAFNVSMDATNYVGRDTAQATNQVLKDQLNSDNQQIKNIAEIIQRVRPDIILLNEFDYIEDPAQGVEVFIKRYLNASQHPALEAIDYPYYYYAPVNTGKPSPFDLNGDGKTMGSQSDAWGFGFFEGHYGMMLLSRYPIETKNIRTFQNFKWKDMPNALRPIDPVSNTPFYSDEVWAQYPLSSKSHWDVPVNVDGETIHILASHPTPPVFDGPEDRNGTKNHDEVRFWLDYITPALSAYIYDDEGSKGGLPSQTRFVIVGDQNSSTTEGDSRKEAISGLLFSSMVNDEQIPQSRGGELHDTNNPLSAFHTAYWGMRADYVLPSRFGVDVIGNGVFWPLKDDDTFRLIESREASSDHRLVWSTLRIR
jgi:hypothetical protein